MSTFRTGLFIVFAAAASFSYDRDLDREENATTMKQSQKWLKKLTRGEFKQGDKKSAYLHFDFSPLLLANADQFLGYKGTDYKRLTVKFTSVKKDAKKPGVYHVIGTSRVGANFCEFTGTIEVASVYERKNLPRGLDDELVDRGFKAAGTMAGKYRLNEKKTGNHCGVFEGIMTVAWYMEKDGTMRYDDLESAYSDSYKNSQYIGTWRSYSSKSLKVSNWGHSRIPYSDRLDCGAAEFSACKQFKKHGWQ